MMCDWGMSWCTHSLVARGWATSLSPLRKIRIGILSISKSCGVMPGTGESSGGRKPAAQPCILFTKANGS